MSNGPERYGRYWRANTRLIGACLLIWGAVSILASIVFVEPLNRVAFFGVPLGFWIAQQGALIVFVVLIFVYAWRMDALDRNYHANE